MEDFTAREFTKLVVFRFGQVFIQERRTTWWDFICPCAQTYVQVDMRTITYEVPRQEMLTRDCVTVAVEAVVNYRVVDAILALTKVADYNSSTRLMAATTLRKVLGTRDLTEVLAEREQLCATMQEIMDSVTEPWGIEVERIDIKDVSLPQILQKAMAIEAEADRQARALILVAEGEVKAAVAMKEASLIIMESPLILQLQYLQTLTKVSADNNRTTVFPFPTEIVETIVEFLRYILNR